MLTGHGLPVLLENPPRREARHHQLRRDLQHRYGKTNQATSTRHSAVDTRAIFLILLTITSTSLIIRESSALSFGQAPSWVPSFGVAAGFGNLAGNTIARQSLLRLANTTGLNFFIANGDLANGYYYGHEADWCKDFHSHYPNLIISAGTHDTGHDFTGSYEIYDANNDGVYDAGDTIIFQGSGSPPVLGTTSLSSQIHVEYVDVGGNGHWIQGDPVLWDEHGVGVVQSQMPLLSGSMPAVGTKLSLDPLLRFYDSTSSFNNPPSGNRNFEAFAAAPACNTPPLLVTGYHYSGIDCSPFLPGQPGYSFPTCYGREFYFDCCQPTAQMRIIVISPGIQNITGQGAGYNINTWNFQAGDPHYNWLNSIIQDATSKALVTMVVSADVCPSLGVEECGEGFHTVKPIDSTYHQYGLDLVNLLASGPVDIWVGGSDYGYERQKQMTSINCPFTATSYSYDGSSIYVNRDICNHISPPGFTGNMYNQGQGYLGVVSAAFGGILRHFNESGEPIVQDLNNNNVYDPGEPVLAWPPPPVGSPLTGPISNAPNNLMFNDMKNTGVYEPMNDTLFFDANGNGQWDPGETILSGPYNLWQWPQHPVKATQFKIVDWNGNGIWDQTVNGSTTEPHHALLGQGPNGYYSTFMGKNTPCNANMCNGHGWLQFTLGSQITGATHFCRDGEHPTSNYSQCISPEVYDDYFTLSLIPAARTVSGGSGFRQV